MKVLIADDDELIRVMLTDILVQLGHDVIAASNGSEAIVLWKRERPDAVVLDFLMPKLSGVDALRSMRSDGRHIPAVMLTAISDRSVREVEGDEAPDVFLEKPFNKKGVEKALAKAMRTG